MSFHSDIVVYTTLSLDFIDVCILGALKDSHH